jgi:hypothetical protein
MTTLKTSTRTSTGRKKEKGKTPQQLEKNRKKGTRGNRLELDGDTIHLQRYASAHPNVLSDVICEARAHEFF